MIYKNGKPAALYDWVMFKNPDNEDQILAGEVQIITDGICEVALTTVANGQTRYKVPAGDCWPCSIAWSILVNGLQKPSTK